MQSIKPEFCDGQWRVKLVQNKIHYDPDLAGCCSGPA